MADSHERESTANLRKLVAFIKGCCLSATKDGSITDIQKYSSRRSDASVPESLESEDIKICCKEHDLEAMMKYGRRQGRDYIVLNSSDSVWILLKRPGKFDEDPPDEKNFGFSESMDGTLKRSFGLNKSCKVRDLKEGEDYPEEILKYMRFIESSEGKNFTTAYEQYTQDKKLHKQLSKLYASFYALHRSSDQSLTLGIGVVQKKCSGGKVLNHPLIEVTVTVSMESSGDVRISPCEGRKPEICSDLLDEFTSMPGGSSISDRLTQLVAPQLGSDEEKEISPFDGSSYKDLLQQASVALSNQCAVVEKDENNLKLENGSFGSDMRIVDTYVIYKSGKSKVSSVISDISKFYDELRDEGCRPPKWCLNLVGFRSDESSECEHASQRYYFPSNSNDEHKQIVNALEKRGVAIVTGPPGTGKTHTVVNLIFHYLAQGLRILVTSKGSDALKVIKANMGTLVPSINELVVSWHESDQVAVNQIETAKPTLDQLSSKGVTPGQQETRDRDQDDLNDAIQRVRDMDKLMAIMAKVRLCPFREDLTIDRRLDRHLNGLCNILDQRDFLSKMLQALKISEESEDDMNRLGLDLLRCSPENLFKKIRPFLQEAEKCCPISEYDYTPSEELCLTLAGGVCPHFFNQQSNEWKKLVAVQSCRTYVLQLNKIFPNSIFQQLMARRVENQRYACLCASKIVPVSTKENLYKTLKSNPDLLGSLQSFINIMHQYKIAKKAMKNNQLINARKIILESNLAKAFPVWIMPTDKVCELMPSKFNSFDLVIMEESSQSDITALSVLFRGTKIIMIGDLKQVSPPIRGETFELEVEKHFQTHLGRIYREGQANQLDSAKPTGGRSIFEFFDVTFAGATRICLKEHFRCAESIISYSNKYVYGDRLVALRKSSSLDPVLYKVVPSGHPDGSYKNQAEADAIIEKVRELIREDRGKVRPRTLGIISLWGAKQAEHIQASLIKDKEIKYNDLERHQIKCGDASSFQGDERDVIFLSMVCCETSQPISSHDGSNLGKFVKWEQSFNVAMSRARDQHILFYSSVQNKNDTDLRLRLVKHFGSVGCELDRGRGTQSQRKCSLSGKELQQLYSDLQTLRFLVRDMTIKSAGEELLSVIIVEGNGKLLGLLACGMIGGEISGIKSWEESFAYICMLAQVEWKLHFIWKSQLDLSYPETLEEIKQALELNEISAPPCIPHEIEGRSEMDGSASGVTQKRSQGLQNVPDDSEVENVSSSDSRVVFPHKKRPVNIEVFKDLQELRKAKSMDDLPSAHLFSPLHLAFLLRKCFDREEAYSFALKAASLTGMKLRKSDTKDEMLCAIAQCKLGNEHNAEQTLYWMIEEKLLQKKVLIPLVERKCLKSMFPELARHGTFDKIPSFLSAKHIAQWLVKLVEGHVTKDLQTRLVTGAASELAEILESGAAVLDGKRQRKPRELLKLSGDGKSYRSIQGHDGSTIEQESLDEHGHGVSNSSKADVLDEDKMALEHHQLETESDDDYDTIQFMEDSGGQGIRGSSHAQSTRLGKRLELAESDGDQMQSSIGTTKQRKLVTIDQVQDFGLEDDDGGGGPSKFSSLRLCPRENFMRGMRLEHYIGRPCLQDVVATMKDEHFKDLRFHRSSGATIEGIASAVQIQSLVIPQSEWNIVMLGETENVIEPSLEPKGHTPKIPRRDISSTLQSFVNISERAYPNLVKAEIIALRLWSGPMFRRYALFLRSLCVCEGRECQPGQHYATTIHALNSAIVKLSKSQNVKALPVVYRGLSLDPPGKKGRPRMLKGVEPCVLAFSEELTIAERYANGGLILKFDAVTSSHHDLALGANISWVSQFPHEKEVLFNVLTYVESVDEPQAQPSGISFWTVCVLQHGENRTLEDLAADN